MSDQFYNFVSEYLTDNDHIYIFNTNTNIEKVSHIINKNNYKKIDIIKFPISNKKFDWYGWQLIRFYHQLKKLNISSEIFSAVFYRGKHLLQYDIGVIPLIIKMISNGGFLTVYDCNWSLEKSPTMNPKVNTDTSDNYTKEQISIHNMQYLLDIYINNEFIEYDEISSNKTRVYNKCKLSTHLEQNTYY